MGDRVLTARCICCWPSSQPCWACFSSGTTQLSIHTYIHVWPELKVFGNTEFLEYDLTFCALYKYSYITFVYLCRKFLHIACVNIWMMNLICCRHRNPLTGKKRVMLHRCTRARWLIQQSNHRFILQIIWCLVTAHLLSNSLAQNSHSSLIPSAESGCTPFSFRLRTGKVSLHPSTLTLQR